MCEWQLEKKQTRLFGPAYMSIVSSNMSPYFSVTSVWLQETAKET